MQVGKSEELREWTRKVIEKIPNLTKPQGGFAWHQTKMTDPKRAERQAKRAQLRVNFRGFTFRYMVINFPPTYLGTVVKLVDPNNPSAINKKLIDKLGWLVDYQVELIRFIFR
jgi:hypothetical protein